MDRRGAPSARRLIYDQSPEHNNLTIEGPGGNGGGCFDYGDAETKSRDNGNGHMDAINFSTECWFAPCSGSGPWVQADLENGLFAGANGSDTNNHGNSGAFVTALLKNNGTTTYAIKGGNAQSGGLTTWYNGALPHPDDSPVAPGHRASHIATRGLQVQVSRIAFPSRSRCFPQRSGSPSSTQYVLR